ncbi:MAG: transglycosylase SLT domain-containing protein [Acetobacteraceae bacterium]|nr:transglycosylase SLT domain-containing protein [Acetobacteraceae bacterium]
MFTARDEVAGMSALPLALVAQLALSCPAAPAFPTGQIVERVAATAQAESGLEPDSIHDNTSRRSYAMPTAAEAIALVKALHAQGHRLDAGLMQVSDANWGRLRLTAASVFEPRTNICAGMTVLGEAYAAERRVSCRYNSGRPDCDNDYPDRIDSALRRVRLDLAGEGPIPTGDGADVPLAPAMPADPFVGHAPARELSFSPLFAPAAPIRAAVPAVPASSLAASKRGGELTSFRSTKQ